MEPYPKLDDIPELKTILTPGVLILLKEKYEIWNNKGFYSVGEFFVLLKKYRYIYVYRLGNGMKNEEIYIKDKIDTIIKCEFEDNRMITFLRSMPAFPLHKVYANKIIPLRINSTPFNQKEKELAVKYMEQQCNAFLSIIC